MMRLEKNIFPHDLIEDQQPMTPYEIITHKRDGHPLDASDINYFIQEYHNGKIPDYQMAALLMAIYFQGMNREEIGYLTKAFINSGCIIELNDLPGKKVDKHSTGGVGDKISIILAPIVAAAGVYVPMISGRGLGHTGGTLDKLAAIPGFHIEFPVNVFIEIVRKTGACLIGQTADLAPVDKKIYALRDVTATIPSIPLIAASIMSKKIAAGIDALVLDIKVGRGAFMRDSASAQELARTLIQVGENYGIATTALLTDMNQPLGYAVGNWLEILECIECLQNRGPADLMQIVYRLAGLMIYLAGNVASAKEGEKEAKRLIRNGTAWNKFLQVVQAQGGDISFLQHTEKFPLSKQSAEVSARQAGWVYQIDALEIGLTCVALGAGRQKITDLIDPKAGILLKVKPGDRVGKNQVLAIIRTDKSEVLAAAVNRLEKAIIISDEKPPPMPLILQFMDKLSS